MVFGEDLWYGNPRGTVVEDPARQEGTEARGRDSCGEACVCHLAYPGAHRGPFEQ